MKNKTYRGDKLIASSLARLGVKEVTTKELVARVTAGTAYKQSQVAHILRKTLDTITRELAQGGQVQLIGFGTFEVKERNARTGINPRTGEVIQLPAHKAPILRASKSLKAAVKFDC